MSIKKLLRKFDLKTTSLWLMRIWSIIFFIFIPLYPKFPLQFLGKETVAIRLDDLFVALGVFFLFLYQLKDKFSIFKLKITKIFLLFFLAGLISTINGVFILKTVAAQTAMLHFLRRIEYALVFFVVYYSLKDKKQVLEYLASLTFGLIGIVVYGLGQKYGNWPVISTMNPEFSKGILLQMSEWTRINSTFAGHYDLAAFLTMILLLLPAVILLTKKKIFKTLEMLVWLACFYILVLTASRISFTAYFIGIVLVLWLLKKRLWIIPVLILNIWAFLSFSDLNQRLLATIPKEKIEKLKNQVAIVLNIFPKKKEIVVVPTPIPEPTEEPVAPVVSVTPTPRLKKKVSTPSAEPIYHEDIAMGTERSTSIRFNAEWPRAIRAFLKNPLLGTGYGSITLATDNDYLRLLGETGILGLLSFALLFIFFIRESLRFVFGKAKDSLVIGFWGVMMMMLANAMFIDVFEASKVAYMFWAFFGLTFAWLNLSYKNELKN